MWNSCRVCVVYCRFISVDGPYDPGDEAPALC